MKCNCHNGNEAVTAIQFLPYLIISSVVLDLFVSNFRFFTTGTFAPGFELPLLPNTGSDDTTIDSVKFDVVNFCPSTTSLFAAVETGGMLASVYEKCKTIKQLVTMSIHNEFGNYL